MEEAYQFINRWFVGLGKERDLGKYRLYAFEESRPPRSA